MKSGNNKAFAELLQNARHQKGLSQSQTAKELKISIKTIQHYEIGNRIPSGDTMLRIIKFFELNNDDVLATLEKQKKQK
jgi:transcriptional regulator with XRE-family HTH domain